MNFQKRLQCLKRPLWCCCSLTLCASFCCLQYYWLFVLSRGLVGIGESSYSSISPTIIGDLFTNNSRTTMLSIFYLAIPLGRWDALIIIPVSSHMKKMQPWFRLQESRPPLL